MINEVETSEGFDKKLNEEHISVWTKQGSPFSNAFYVIKGKYTFGGNTDTLEFTRLLNEKRTEWDKNILQQSEIAKVSGEVDLIYTLVKAPVIFMQSRDFIEKRIRFFHEGVYYTYSSSIPSTEFQSSDKYQRCENIYSGAILMRENNEYVYYTFAQIDYKVRHYLSNK